MHPSGVWLPSCLSSPRYNKMPRDEWLKQQVSTLYGTHGWKSEVKVPVASVLDESLLPGSQSACHGVLRWPSEDTLVFLALLTRTYHHGASTGPRLPLSPPKDPIS